MLSKKSMMNKLMIGIEVIDNYIGIA